jgi:alcohol dehydrogenase (cytochrome c)
MTCRTLFGKWPTRAVAAIGLSLLFGGGAGFAQAPAPGTEDPNNWPQYHRTSNAWQYSPLDQINKSNVGKLKVAWIHQGGDITHGIQETPIVVDGVIYSITANNRVVAIDAKTGADIWRFEPKLNPIIKKVLFAPYSRGVAVGKGKVFIGTVDGRGIALDQKTGKELWQTQLTDFVNCHGCNFTSPPVLAGDVLTFGSTAGELATAGKIFGVNPDTGVKLWEFNTIKQDQESWAGESGTYGGGGAWMPGTYDAETNTLYYGTGNPGKDFYGMDREGDNLYTDCVIALDPKTGALKWYRQEIKHDVWDYDSPYETLMLKRDGKDLLVHLNKSGFVFVLDKNNGNIENIWRLSETINFAKDIDKKTGELIGRVDLEVNKPTLICPWAGGARSWNAGAYSPKTRLWYTAANELCGTLTPRVQKTDPKDYGTGHIGADDFGKLSLAPGHPPARIDARDPITGERKWTYELKAPSTSTVLATAGDLVFVGDPFGTFRALDADSGKMLWAFNTGSGMRGGIVSYAVGGKQYVLAASGWGSYMSLLLPAAFPELANVPSAATLIAFTLED